MDRTPQPDPHQRPQSQDKTQDTGLHADALPATLSGRVRQALADVMPRVEDFFRKLSDGLEGFNERQIFGIDKGSKSVRREQASRMLNGKGNEEDIELLARRMSYDPKERTITLPTRSSDPAADERIGRLLADAKLERFLEHEASTKRQVATALAALNPSATEEHVRYFAALTKVALDGTWSINLSTLDSMYGGPSLAALGIHPPRPDDPNLAQKHVYFDLTSTNELGRRLLGNQTGLEPPRESEGLITYEEAKRRAAVLMDRE